MGNRILKVGETVTVRLDDVFLASEKYLTDPYVSPDNNKQRFFGNLKFKEPAMALATMKEAVKETGAGRPTWFTGPNAKWKEDNYGTSLTVNGHPRFFTDTNCTEEVEPERVLDYVYSAELHLSVTKDNDVFIRIVRLIVLSEKEDNYNDDLFKDDMPF